MGKPCFLFLVLLLSWAAPAFAKSRHVVESSLRVKDLTSGEAILFDDSYTYEITEKSGEKARIRFFDAWGMEVMGDYEVPTRLIEDALKQDIREGLRTGAAGAEMKPGCCDVSGAQAEALVGEVATGELPMTEVPLGATRIPERNPVRSPAIAPGTSIVYADDIFVPKLAPIPKLLSLPKVAQGSIPKPTPKPRAVTPREELVAVSREEVPRVSLPRRVTVPPRRPLTVGRDARKESRVSEERRGEDDEEGGDVEGQPRRRSVASGSGDPLCRAFDTFRAKGVPDAPLRQALYFLSRARADDRFGRAKNGQSVSGDSRYLAIGDYAQRSDRKRFYLLDLESLTMRVEKVSHGGGKRRAGNPGDPNNDGNVDKCSRRAGDGMHRAGFFRVGEYYLSTKHRYKWPLLTRRPARNGMRLDGLTRGVNWRAREDGVVMHEATYNDEQGKMGRSFSCPAFVPGEGKSIMDKLAEGSLYYSYTPACRSDMVKTLEQVRGWQGFCR